MLAAMRIDPKILFFAGLIVCASGLLSPAIALSCGLAYGLSFAHPYQADSRDLSRFLLQASVVGLGFGMNLQEVMRAGRSGFAYTAMSIAFALAIGLTLGLLLRVDRTASFLITAGTAICGGSAIAAIAPIIEANDEETAVSLGTIFILNSIALLIFPGFGWALHLSQQQFGLWSALAIHDTSSVVGATARYGAVALVVGTTVKLTRALWIVPMSVGAAVMHRSRSAKDANGTKSRIRWPWFILFFVLAAMVNTYAPHLGPATQALYRLGKLGLTATLYLIGTGISCATVKQVGVRPMLQGVILWILVGSTSLWLIVKGVISLS
ncbi:MAG: putative sulfate exporter family transporter [Candidatus Acidiferrales bacterium]